MEALAFVTGLGVHHVTGQPLHFYCVTNANHIENMFKNIFRFCELDVVMARLMRRRHQSDREWIRLERAWRLTDQCMTGVAGRPPIE